MVERNIALNYFSDIKEYFQRKDPEKENQNEKPPYVFSYLIDNVVQCTLLFCIYCIVDYFWPGYGLIFHSLLQKDNNLK